MATSFSLQEGRMSEMASLQLMGCWVGVERNDLPLAEARQEHSLGTRGTH